MAVRCNIDRVIKDSPQWEIMRHRNGDTADIIETILYADMHSADFVLSGAECLQGSTEYRTFENVWTFVKYNLKYKPDRPGHERIKSPGALFKSGYGDCKSYSVAIGAILRAFSIPYRYRFASYDNGDFTHVYVIATMKNGEDVVLDAVHKRFDDEVPYRHHKDIKPAQPTSINGVNSISIDPIPAILGALFGFVFCKLI